jgi:large repetitive protein
MNLQKIRYTNYAGELNGSPQSECSGYDNWRKFNDKGEISEENTSANPIDLTLTTPKDGGEYIGFDWSSQQGIAKINVKAGDDDSNVYEFDVPYPTAGSGSTKNNKGISHITFCWNEPEPDPTPTLTPTSTEVPTPEPTPEITLNKSAYPVNFYAVGNTIEYTYVITNTGNVPLFAPYSVSDDKVSVSCPSEPASLVEGGTVTCSAVYTITQDDLNAGSVTNIAVASAKDKAGADIVSNQDSVTVTAELTKTLILDKSASPMNYSSVGETINYSYLLTNNGNVALTGPFSVSDDKTSVSCPDEPASLQPSESLTCSATYVITEDDLSAGSVTNTAIAYAEGGNVVSNTDSVTVEGPKANPHIQLIKEVLAVNGDTSSKVFINPGDIVTYTFTVTNTGNVPLTNVIVTDPAASVSGGPISLDAGASDNSSFTAIYIITEADFFAETFTNTATVTGKAPNGDKVTAHDSATVKQAQLY